MKDEMYVILIIAFILGFFLSHISSNLVEGVMGEGDVWCKGNARDRSSSDQASQFCPAITPGGDTVPCPAADGSIRWPENIDIKGNVVNGFGMDKTGTNLYKLVSDSVKGTKFSIEDYLAYPSEVSDYDYNDIGWMQDGRTFEDVHRASDRLGVPNAVWKHETCNPDKSDLPPNCDIYQNMYGTEGGGYWFLHSLCPVDAPTPPTSKLTCGTDVNGDTDDYKCPDGDKLKPNPTKITCKGVDCTDEECCNTPSPPSPPSPTPPPSPPSPPPTPTPSPPTLGQCSVCRDDENHQETNGGKCMTYNARHQEWHQPAGEADACLCPENTVGTDFQCLHKTNVRGGRHGCIDQDGKQVCPKYNQSEESIIPRGMR